MAFGHGPTSETHDFRSVPVGVGAVTLAKQDGLGQLREACLAALRTFAQAAFEQEPLHGTLSKAQLTRKLLALQKGYKGLNKAYLERCRTTVIAAVSEQHKRYFGQLLGRMRNCATEIAEPRDDGRRYYYVPLELQDEVCAAELEALQVCAEDGAQALALLRATLAGRPTGLTEAQSQVLLEVHRQVQERHRAPAFGGADTVVALALDYRVLPADWRDLPGRLDNAVAQLLQDPANRRYGFFLGIAHPTPGGERIRLPLCLSAELLREQFSAGQRKFKARGLTLLLGPHSVELRLSVAQPREAPKPLDQVRYLLGRDFGQRNTVSLSLLRLERALDAQEVRTLQAMGRQEARAWLTSNAAPDAVFAARWRHSGEKFLARIAVHASRIDELRSKIDVGYAALETEKAALAALLGLEPAAEGFLPRIERQMAPKGHALHGRVQAFLRLLAHVGDLKAARRLCYRRIAALKRCWFGHLANLERAVALEWGAAVVCEDLTYVTPERGTPEYKGRAFNRVMNHASRGQYARAAESKLSWNGVPVIAVPSWYTSTTCFRHASVQAAYRRGDVFRCPHCRAEGREAQHADEHAADTLAVYLQLTAKSTLRDKHALQ